MKVKDNQEIWFEDEEGVLYHVYTHPFSTEED